MTPEQKQRVAKLNDQHSPKQENCQTCFLLTLLDQAQRDTERVREAVGLIRANEAQICGEPYDGRFRQGYSNACDMAISHIDSALDQAALARGEGEK